MTQIKYPYWYTGNRRAPKNEYWDPRSQDYRWDGHIGFTYGMCPSIMPRFAPYLIPPFDKMRNGRLARCPSGDSGTGSGAPRLQNAAQAEQDSHTPSPLQHHDFLNDVPAFRYIPRCGHSVWYTLPIPLGEHGYCYRCRDYFERDRSVKEFAPPAGRKHLSDKAITRAVDGAITRNKVAEILVNVEPEPVDFGETPPNDEELPDDRVREIAAEAGVGQNLVREVWEHLYDDNISGDRRSSALKRLQHDNARRAALYSNMAEAS
jgi:hypothetical protein